MYLTQSIRLVTPTTCFISRDIPEASVPKSILHRAYDWLLQLQVLYHMAVLRPLSPMYLTQSIRLVTPTTCFISRNIPEASVTKSILHRAYDWLLQLQVLYHVAVLRPLSPKVSYTEHTIGYFNYKFYIMWQS